MNFGIKRLTTDTETTRQYHLFDGAGTLMLVADQGSPWLADQRYHVRFARPDGQPVAVLDWPQAAVGRRRQGLSEQNYAMVLDDAVYAILTAFCTDRPRPEASAAAAAAPAATIALTPPDASAAAAPTTEPSPTAASVPTNAPAAAASPTATDAPAQPAATGRDSGRKRLAFITIDVGEARFLVLTPADGGAGADIYLGVPAGLLFYGQVDRDKLPEPVGHIKTAISYTFIAELPPRTFPREDLLMLALVYLLDEACRPAAPR